MFNDFIEIVSLEYAHPSQRLGYAMHVNKCSNSSTWVLLYARRQYPPRSSPTPPSGTAQKASLFQEHLCGSVSFDDHEIYEISASMIRNGRPILLFQQCPEIHLIAANEFLNRLLIQHPVFNALLLTPRAIPCLIIVIVVIIISKCCS